MRLIIIALAVFHCVCAHGQFGPGGVGSPSTNGLWLDASSITPNANTVEIWNDDSGNGNPARNQTSAEQPVYVSNGINGKPSLRFDGSDDQMEVNNNHTILDGTSGITMFAVVRPTNLDGKPRGIFGKRVDQNTSTNYAYTFFFYHGYKLNLDVTTQNNRFATPVGFNNGKDYLLAFDFDGTQPVEKRSRIFNGGNLLAESIESSTLVQNSDRGLTLGGLNYDYTNGGFYRLGGLYSEIIHFNYRLNTAQRIIVENYLGAKYGITVANKMYHHESSHDHDVAGIGKEDNSNFHDDAQGRSIVRINNPSNLTGRDYLMWGHNGASLEYNNIIDVDQATIQSRMSRTWKVSKTGDLGKVDMTFDISDFSPVTASDIRLLVTQSTFANANVIDYATIINGDKIVFEGVELFDGDSFTLGSINVEQTPLPVELTDFNAISNEKNVEINWSTASELDADYYLVQKSKYGVDFNNIARIKAVGTTTNRSEYSIIDDSPFSGISYYRLIQVDINGEETKYGTVSVDRVQDQAFSIVPNPSNGRFRVKSAIATMENTNVSILNATGQKVYDLTLQPNELNYKHINLNLNSGLYMVRVSQSNGASAVLKLFVK
ncbi:T9SS type A sorting domain-containing protein [Brumimicrobium aurantiacum]|uniref:T9SS C-terminal target domain-containing protein n=1 Tax=Brumimicrobium aurantiacum TaxID=1737063 RepID=A0A3E1F1M4_9FLAO|nr:T9SS type A sorting domain-containing protein [Brumimicrobium aurantiacum]RFC55714.1 T9SS C-terminal target domain-containing protein [Brumimicrobium aurantiacum]